MRIWEEIFTRETQIWSKPDVDIALLIEKLFLRNLKSNYNLDRRGGRQTVYLAKKDFKVLNSDILPLMLRSVTFKLIKSNLPPKLIEADITKQPFRNSAFDAVIALGVLLHNTLPNLKHTINDINRIMKEGGILFATFKSPAAKDDSQYGNESNQIDESRTRLVLASQSDHLQIGQAYQFLTKSQIIELLKDFKIIEMEGCKYENQLCYLGQDIPKYNTLWAVVAEKIRDGEAWIGSSQRYKNRASTRANLIEHFLNESFVRDLFKIHLHMLNLSEYKILNCEINPFKMSKKGGIAAFEVKLHLHSKTNQQGISKNFIGKWRRDGRVREIFDLLQEVWQNGFNSDNDTLKICEPIAYFPDYNLMLTTKARGIELESVLKQDNAGLLEGYVGQAASWLVKLHSTQVNHGRMFSIKLEEEKFKKWSEHLCWLYPDFAEKIQNMLSCILDKERSLNPEYLTLIHGDFHPLNIFVDGTDITVIDFEQSCIFDPAKDLGYFISYLTMRKRKYNLSIDTQPLQKHFLDRYMLESSSRNHLGRIAIYEARSYLQHLHFRYWTLNKRVDPINCNYWLDKVEECLLGDRVYN